MSRKPRVVAFCWNWRRRILEMNGDPTRMETVRLLLLDDHMLFRESLSRLLESEPDFEMAGHCSSVQEALDVLGCREVDLVLLDFDLGQDSAFQFIGRVRELPV